MEYILEKVGLGPWAHRRRMRCARCGAAVMRRRAERRGGRSAGVSFLIRGTSLLEIEPVHNRIFFDSLRNAMPTQQKVCISNFSPLLHARFIPRWKYRFSSDQRSQATLGTVSTGVGDQPGTQCDLAFFSLRCCTFFRNFFSMGPMILQTMLHFNGCGIVLLFRGRGPIN